MTETNETFNQKNGSNLKIFLGAVGGLLIGCLLTFSICAVIYVIFILGNANKVGDTDNIDVIKKSNFIIDIIDDLYLEEYSKKDMEEGVYRGILDSLGDPYSCYYSKEEVDEIMEDSVGIYFGIGAYIGMDKLTNLPIIARVIDNTPAQESGIHMNDTIISVDGVDIGGMELEDVTALIKGPENTKVKLTIYRENEPDYMEIEVTRKQIEEPTVSNEMLDDKIGYISILSFDEITVDQVKESLDKLESDGMESLIIDLRGNPGGNLSSVVDICRMLLPEGLIVYTEDKYGEREEYNCDGKNKIDIPLVVLIDGQSASASEILAGAIKDYEVGTLIGMTTYGKGIVQRLCPMSDGTAVKLTISHYYTPKGNNIHGIGVKPDIEVEFDGQKFIDEEIDNQLEAAKEFLQNK